MYYHVKLFTALWSALGYITLIIVLDKRMLILYFTLNIRFHILAFFTKNKIIYILQMMWPIIKIRICFYIVKFEIKNIWIMLCLVFIPPYLYYLVFTFDGTVNWLNVKLTYSWNMHSYIVCAYKYFQCFD